MSKKDEITLRKIRGDRRIAAATIRSIMERVDDVNVSKDRTLELEFERELLLVAFQTLMKPSMLSPEEKRIEKELELD